MAGIRVRCEVCTRQFRRPAGTDEARCSEHRTAAAAAPARAAKPAAAPRASRSRFQVVDDAAPPQAVGPVGTVEAATFQALVDAERVTTPLGVATLKLARELDAASGVAAARVSADFRRSLEAALEGARPPADALDDIRSRREAKAAGA